MFNGSVYFFPSSWTLWWVWVGRGKGGGGEKRLLGEAVSQADAAAAKYINPCCGGLTRMGIAWERLSPNSPSATHIATPFTAHKGHSRGRKRNSHKTGATTTPFRNISTADCIRVYPQLRSK